MNLLEQLKENKGTVSSELSKQFAKAVLEGKIEILNEAVELIHYESKNVRSGAAKIIEKVAEEKPKLVAKHLDKLIDALSYEEPQTKWMMIHVFGLCAKLQPQFAREIFTTATKYLSPDYGTVLRDRAITYLGYFGAISENDCNTAFPLLIESFTNHPDRITRIFESFERMTGIMNPQQKKELSKYCEEYSLHQQAGIKKWALKVSKNLQ